MSQDLNKILNSLPDSNDIVKKFTCEACGARAVHRRTYIPPDDWDYRHFHLCDKCIEKINASVYKTLKSFGIARLEIPEEFRDELPF